jgi:hypothetical protein
MTPFSAVGSILIAAGLTGLIVGGAFEVIFRADAPPELTGGLAGLLLIALGIGAWRLGGD